MNQRVNRLSVKAVSATTRSLENNKVVEQRNLLPTIMCRALSGKLEKL